MLNLITARGSLAYNLSEGETSIFILVYLSINKIFKTLISHELFQN